MRAHRLSFRHLLGLLAIGGGIAAAEGCGASIIVVECEGDLELCDQECVDTDSNEDHCGGCNQRCTEGGCIGGECQGDPTPCQGPQCDPGCGEGLSDCGGGCVDLQTDPANCGACLVACADGEACEAGACGSSCLCDRCDVIELPSEVDVVRSGTTVGLPDQWSPTCTGGGAPDVAYHYVAPETATYVFDTQGSSYDTVVSLLAGCAEVSCVDDTELGAAAYAPIFLEAGQEVTAIVDGYGGGSGNYTLHVYQEDGMCAGLTLCNGACVDISTDPSHCGGCFNPCGPDEYCDFGICTCGFPDCTCKFPICGACNVQASLPPTVPISTSGNTAGQPDVFGSACGGDGAPEVTYVFVAPTTANYAIDTLGSSFDTVLSVFDTQSCGDLGCNDDWSNLDSLVVVGLQAGQEILIVVDGLGDEGAFNLHVDYADVAPPPGN